MAEKPFPHYAVCIANECHPATLRLLENYILKMHDDQDYYLFSDHFEIQFPFVELNVWPLPDDLQTRQPRKVFLPTQLVLAVEAGNTEEDIRRLGFV